LFFVFIRNLGYNVVYYFTIRKPGRQEKWKEKP